MKTAPEVDFLGIFRMRVMKGSIADPKPSGYVVGFLVMEGRRFVLRLLSADEEFWGSNSIYRTM